MTHDPRDIHVPHCACDCGGSYLCPACEHICGWCFGAHDEMPAVCDNCWFRIDSISADVDQALADAGDDT